MSRPLASVPTFQALVGPTSGAASLPLTVRALALSYTYSLGSFVGLRVKSYMAPLGVANTSRFSPPLQLGVTTAA